MKGVKRPLLLLIAVTQACHSVKVVRRSAQPQEPPGPPPGPPGPTGPTGPPPNTTPQPPDDGCINQVVLVEEESAINKCNVKIKKMSRCDLKSFF